jgi:hypothetical protein
VPSWIRVFKPKFIVRVHFDEDHILVTDDE